MARTRWLGDAAARGRRRALRPLLACALLPMLSMSGTAKVTDLAWTQLPALPPSPGQPRQPGVAGPFVGVHHDALIVGGGANFPDKLPWDGGAKVWWRDIFVLENLASEKPTWARQTFPLSRPLGYGVSVSTPEGVVCVGGSDAERCYADAFLLSWDPATHQLRRTELPPMPEPLAFMAGALVGQTVFVAGGQHTMKGAVPSSAFYALDWSKRKSAGFKWEVMPGWPGPARILPVAAAQRTSGGEEFFLFSGRVPQGGRRTEILTDAYAFDPKKRAWRNLPKIGGGAGVSVMAGTAAAVGTDEILLFGGDRGDLFLELETHDLAIESLRMRLADAIGGARAPLEAEIETHLQAKKKIYASHPGFGREVFAYDTRRNSWRVVTRSPVAPQVTTIAVATSSGIIIPSGEIQPGIRTTAVVRVKPLEK